MKRILIGLKFIFTGKIHGIKEHHVEALSTIMSPNLDHVVESYYELEKILPNDFKLKHESFMSNFFSEIYNNKRNCDKILGKYKYNEQ